MLGRSGQWPGIRDKNVETGSEQSCSSRNSFLLKIQATVKRRPVQRRNKKTFERIILLLSPISPPGHAPVNLSVSNNIISTKSRRNVGRHECQGMANKAKLRFQGVCRSYVETSKASKGRGEKPQKSFRKFQPRPNNIPRITLPFVPIPLPL